MVRVARGLIWEFGVRRDSIEQRRGRGLGGQTYGERAGNGEEDNLLALPRVRGELGGYRCEEIPVSAG